MKGRDSGTLPPQLSTPSTCVSGSVRSCFPFIFGSNSSSKFASYQRYLILAILTIYSHDFPRENLLLSGKGTFSCMSFTFAPLVGVEYFRAFFGRERCVLCFCALKKSPLDTLSEVPNMSVMTHSFVPLLIRNKEHPMHK